MRWTLLALLLVALVAIAAAGSHKAGKGHHKDKKEVRTLEAKRAELKESHGKEQKKCTGKKCGGSEKYTKDAKKVEKDVTVEEAPSRGKREAEPSAAAEAKFSKKHKKVPTAYDGKPKKTKTKSKSKSNGADPVQDEVVADVADGVREDASLAKEQKTGKKVVKRSAVELDRAEPAPDKAPKGKKKASEQTEPTKKQKLVKKAAKDQKQQQQRPEERLVEETVPVVKVAGDAVAKPQGPVGVAEETCANDQCAPNEE